MKKLVIYGLIVGALVLIALSINKTGKIREIFTPTSLPVSIEKKGKITLSFAGWFTMEKSGLRAWKRIKASFEEKHPGIVIEYIGIPYDNTCEQLLIMAENGYPPDVGYIGAQWISQLAARKAIEPLDDEFSAAYLDDHFQQGGLDTGKYRGRLYAIPWVLAPNILFYNKLLMRKAGLDPDNPPKTIEEFDGMVRKIGALKKDGHKVYGFGASTAIKEITAAHWFPWLWSFGGDFLDDENRIIVNNTAAVEAMSWYQDMTREELMPLGLEAKDIRAIFVRDRLGFMIDGTWVRGILRDISGIGAEFDSHYGVCTIPVGKSGKSESLAANHSLVLFKNCKHKKEVLELIKYLTSDKEIVEMLHGELGMIAPLKSLLRGSEFDDDYTRPSIKQMDTARAADWQYPMYTAAMDCLAVAIQEVLIDKADPQKALDKAAAKIKELYPQSPPH